MGFLLALFLSVGHADVSFRCLGDKGSFDWVEGVYIDAAEDSVRLKVSATFFIIDHARYGPFIDLKQNWITSRRRLTFSHIYTGSSGREVTVFTTTANAFKRASGRFRAELTSDRVYKLNCEYVESVKFQ